MKKLAALAGVMLWCGMGWAQAAATDSQTLQAILVEMRGIHNDVRLSETTHILLTELQMQQGVVDKAIEKRDAAKTRMSQLDQNEKNYDTGLARLEENAKTALDQAQQKQIESQIENMKSTMVMFKGQETDAATSLQDAENALRKAQESLSGIQEQLDTVVKQLQPVAK
jgi:chromosome segregation ATPase